MKDIPDDVVVLVPNGKDNGETWLYIFKTGIDIYKSGHVKKGSLASIIPPGKTAVLFLNRTYDACKD